MAMGQVRQCQYCGEQFEIGRYQTAKKYCSEQCAEWARQEWFATHPYRTNYGDAKCPVCGTGFRKTYKNQTYCSQPCAHKARIGKKNVKKPVSTETADAPKPIPKTKKTCAEICAEAEAAHMTYGRYIALLYMQAQKGIVNPVQVGKMHREGGIS